MSIVLILGDSLYAAAGMFWSMLWALVLGFGISGAVQVFISKEKMVRALGKAGPRELALATFWGTVSSSCSFAATSMARSLFQKGAHIISALAFMLASTNLVIELSVVIWAMMGWRFVIAEFLGGLLLVVIMALLMYFFAPIKEFEGKRRLETAEGESEVTANPKELEGWREAAQAAIMECKMIWKDIVLGVVISGFVMVLVPNSFWQIFFLQSGDHSSFLRVVENAMVGPLISMVSFVCSVGNIPLANVLYHQGLNFGGTLSFIYADLIIVPLILIYRKYYGTKLALWITAVFYVSMVLTGILVEGLFNIIGFTPASHEMQMTMHEGMDFFQMNYTFWLNSVAMVVAGLAVIFAKRSKVTKAHCCSMVLVLIVSLMATANVQAQESDMEVWDPDMNMSAPLPMKDMPMGMGMIHGNAFGVGSTEQGPRGRRAITGPNMFMIDIGHSVGDHHYFNVDFMGTLEKWTFPTNGNPLLMQIGESNSQGVPFLDAQHPHSSPVMGLTLSDTFRFNDESKNNLKLFFAPRGQSTDGPIAFMHRTTGMVNPDAPLGHHIGQDVGHITSTVIGSKVEIADTQVEVSTFHGEEPEPTEVDLPLGTPDSGSIRLIQKLSSKVIAMASAAYVHHPEAHEHEINHLWRYSASVYNKYELLNGMTFDNTFIYGLITNYDHALPLNSFAEEFAFKKDGRALWGRIEVLQRTPAELSVTATDQNRGRWVSAFTLGFTQQIVKLTSAELSIGISGTKDFLPGDLIGAYGGNPWSGKIFLQLSGMKMWEF